MKISDAKLKDLLVGPGHIGEADFEINKKEAKEKKTTLVDLFVEKGLIADDNLGKTIANGFQYHFINLTKAKISDDTLQIIPENVAKNQEVIAFERNGDTVKIGTPNPDNYEFIKQLERKIGHHVEVYYATRLGVLKALKYYKSDLGARVKGLIEELGTNFQNEHNIVTLVNVFLEYAHDNGASDIHIEPMEKNVSVRFRVDGVLHEVAQYPRALHDKITFRIKIMASLRTDEHGSAQDGRFDYAMDKKKFDVRVSILPITNGENIVMRLLSESSRRYSFEDLGLLGDDFKKVKRASQKPHGMILAVGPTGSGKTTTLYSVLRVLNRPEVNIMTIEDPVEYNIEHVQQTQVNQKKKLTFATGLRSIVRQDPDIIMVGEIRDNETSNIAVNAAMTGHLLLSTLHSNDAATALPRLMDMGVEPFLVSSSVNVIIAQRLVRKVCERCRASYHFDEKTLKQLRLDSVLVKMIEKINKKKNISKITLYKGAGCKACGNTGYSGRVGIFEVMEIDDEIRTLIAVKASADDINKKAKERGMTSMLYDGLAKVSQGITTIDEVLRATKT